MMVASSPGAFDTAFATTLSAVKSSFVHDDGQAARIDQHGAALVTPDQPFPGWPEFDDAILADLNEAVIETYLVSEDEPPIPLSDNDPFVSAWLELATWVAAAMRAALDQQGLNLAGSGYVTASITPSASLAGQAHMDDDAFVPTDNVGVVAIVGQHVGPRVATQPLRPKPLRAMSQVQYTDEVLQAFEANEVDHCAAPADQITLFPQFGQLHAGPPADPVAAIAPWRQLLVFRASVTNSSLLVGLPGLG